MNVDSFEGFIGQEHWQRYFGNLIPTRKMSHAYLFSGPAHLGKRTFVQRLSRRLLCFSLIKGEPCGTCISCRAWRGTFHPELVTVAIEEGASRIGVEAVRNFTAALIHAPSEGGYRLGVLEDLDRVTPEGLGVLLKTIEEPAPSVILLLIADTVTPLPATVRSRLAHCTFTPVDRGSLVAALRHRGANHATAEELAALAGGRSGLALTWLQEKGSRQRYESEAERFIELCRSSLQARFAFSEAVAKSEDCSPSELTSVLGHWTIVLRDIMLNAANAPGLTTHARLASEYHAFAHEKPLAYWLKRYQALEETLHALAANANRRLALNTFFVHL